MQRKILLLEDDITLSDTIAEYLQDADFEVICAYDGEEAIEKVYENRFDLLLLDVNVPLLNGFKVLKQIRENQKTPAIFITSLNSMQSLEEGFDSGCDDYIRKPFVLKELLLRVNTILKREYSSKEEIIKIDENLSFNMKSHTLIKNGEVQNLHNKELKLLKLFLLNPNELLVHERIYDHVWEYDEDISDTSLRTYIKNLRKILGKEKIVSLKKLGYRFNS
ncbi:response regulator transcription factor [Malaciobacter mytili]|uniref:Two-component system response regulator n=1 Tax=Malaciobacter mytili LMG 24559 TaxID=1032238 RepID=A0AAX2AI05_9BACT|nr:response regulator transcription factor [Malaciobacter mytili]AXH15240.1 two-component system response regulator [Malaciobacter mytili LMG 24559]RXK15568.1 two-component system response regulator [Malaciobacter mytili LMG 24559]